MIEFDKAVSHLMTCKTDTASERVETQGFLGKYLVWPIRDRVDLPPFIKSAMDGYAIQAADRSTEYKILETVAAGEVPSKTLGIGQCIRIMTGAMVPAEADMVVRVENTTTDAGMMRIFTPKAISNVIQKGENPQVGEIVLHPGVMWKSSSRPLPGAYDRHRIEEPGGNLGGGPDI